MKKRLHQLWIPGFLTFILSTVFLMTLRNWASSRASSGTARMRFFFARRAGVALFVGALGAYLSSRAGGSRGAALFASVFPVLGAYYGVSLDVSIDLIVERAIGNHVDFSIVATALLREGIGWILVPGAALLVGGLLVQFLLSRRLTSRSVAGS